MSAISPLSSDTYATQQIYQANPSSDNDQLLQQVADKLGIDPSKLQDAIQQARANGEKGKDLLTSVANQLGIQPDALQQAFQQAAQGARVHHRHHHHHGEQTPSTTSTTAGQTSTVPVQGTDGTININA